MNKEIEYQIYIGCSDKYTHNSEVSLEELESLVSSYFSKAEIGFSLVSVRGGYLHEDGRYETEKTLCIDLIGKQGMNIETLAKSLSMYMNQECILITKEEVEREFR